MRYMDWEYTWPTARVVEAAFHEDRDSEDYRDVVGLRPAGPLMAFVQTNFGSRVLEGQTLEECLTPVALQCVVNLEYIHWRIVNYYDIRTFWLSHFISTPNRDILWLSDDLLQEPEHLLELQQSYRKQLSWFKKVLIEDFDWDDEKPDDYTEGFLSMLDALESILLLTSDFDDDGNVLAPDAEELTLRARRYRAEYERFSNSVKIRNGVADRIL
jgi:hypothetical protein